MAKTRSPNYPAISLPDAIVEAEKIYSKNHQARMQKQAVARALGYSGLNGASLTKISALYKYGLLEKTKDQFAISTSAILMIRGAPDSIERAEALKVAIAAPAVFQKLLEFYGWQAPDQETIRIRLETKMGFKPGAAKKGAANFRDSVEFVTGLDVAYLDAQDQDTRAEGGMQFQGPQQQASQRALQRQNSPLPVLGGETLRYRLGKNCTVQVAFDGQVTQDAVEKLCAFLKLGKDAYPELADIENLETSSQDEEADNS